MCLSHVVPICIPGPHASTCHMYICNMNEKNLSGSGTIKKGPKKRRKEMQREKMVANKKNKKFQNRPDQHLLKMVAVKQFLLSQFHTGVDIRVGDAQLGTGRDWVEGIVEKINTITVHHKTQKQPKSKDIHQAIKAVNKTT